MIDDLINIQSLKLSGGFLCLDFANTLDGRNSSDIIEYLTTYSDLVEWCQRVDLLQDNEVQTLLQKAQAHPDEANAILQRALRLRETIYRLFSATITTREPEASDLALLNSELAEAQVHSGIMAHQGTFSWMWRDKEGAFDAMLWAITRSTIDLLTSSTKDQVRECQGRNCGWLFLDTSKNHSRRWCNMDSCGNRAKSHRHYLRKKHGGLSSALVS